MPTGYTAKLMESGQSFQDFVMLCARSFGACVTMRDDSLETPIPERFEPSDYNSKRIAEANTELERLTSMSKSQKLAFGEARKSDSLASSKKWLAKEMAENRRLEQMERRVSNWTPPTKEHEGLKKFMLEQIAMSKHDLSYIERSIRETKSKKPIAFYSDAVESAKRSLEYNRQGHDEEVERARSRTEWVRQLRESI